jgi:hypothetical protein
MINIEIWKEIETNIDFSKYNPIKTGSSLHVYSEIYLIEEKTYRLSFVEGSDEQLIEILDKTYTL